MNQIDINGEDSAEKIYFLNIDLNTTMTGIEHASLMRGKLFCEHLGKSVTIVTSTYNSQFAKIRQALYEMSMLPRQCEMISLYEFMQETESYQGKPVILPPPKSNGSYIKYVKNTNDYKVYNNQNTMIMYRKCDENGYPEYDNIFANRRKIRRDHYDCNGHLSRSQHLNPKDSSVMSEQYYRTDGSVCMFKYFNAEKDADRLACIYLTNRENQIEEIFYNEQEWIAYWLQKLTEKNKMSIFLVDKERVFFNAVKSIKSHQNRIICAIHSAHFNGNDLMKGGINSNYRAIFEDLNSPDAIVILSRLQKLHIEKRFGQRENIYCIPHATEYIEQNLDYTRRNPFKVIYIARYSPEKQHVLMADIFKNVVSKCPQARLEFYGAGSLKKEIQEHVDKIGMSEHIAVNGYICNKREALLEAGLTVLPSRREGFSLFVLESISYGCPTVSFDMYYGPSDMIDNGKNGYLVELNDGEAMANAIVEIMQNPELAKIMSEEAIRKAEQFSTKEIAKFWGELLQGII